jgi:DNA modification methylase
LTPEVFTAELVTVFRQLRRVLRSDGTAWLNLGDSYSGSGKGGNPDAGKQATNRGSQSIGVLYGKTGETARQAAATNVSRRLTAELGFAPKQLMGIPWRVAFALQADGWWLRSAIIWAKPNGMPGSQEDRCTSSYEMVFQLSRSADYWEDFDAIKTPPRESTLIRTAEDIQSQAGSHRAHGGTKTMKAVGGNNHGSTITGSAHGRHSLGAAVPEKQRRSDKQRGHSRTHAGFNDRWDAMERTEQSARPAMMRDVWFVSPASYAEAHFAVMSDEIARRCILAGCPKGGTVLDPFGGAGTTGMVADRFGRNAIMIELNPEYADMAERRIRNDAGMFAEIGC